jgi:MoaA/NifB/PqqE/SkfB family radical SAM enzyme
MKLNLKEVLWEITPKCNRNCTFCGSNEIVNVEDQLVWEDILTIGDNIAKYAETIIMSGGEPLTIPTIKLHDIKNLCIEHDTNLDVVTNGDLLGKNHKNIFRNIGISINSLEDIRSLNIDNLKVLSEDSDIVFITNINRLNDIEIDRIVEEARNIMHVHMGFQFQLTMYKGDDDAKIDGEHIAYLRERLEIACSTMQMPYIFADNLQAVHECTAGINSCGVLFNGDVVACLSERSWNTDYEICKKTEDCKPDRLIVEPYQYPNTYEGLLNDVVPPPNYTFNTPICSYGVVVPPYTSYNNPTTSEPIIFDNMIKKLKSLNDNEELS